MKNAVLASVTVFCVLTGVCAAQALTKIEYDTLDLGQGRWEFIYTVSNIGLSSGIEQFTVWFSEELYHDLVVTTPLPLANQWDQIILPPDLVLGDSGAFDALASNSYPGIQGGETISGFSVAFDWLGQGQPGPQFYEIINPQTFGTIESGYTIPEPASGLILGLGILINASRRKHSLAS